MASSKSKLSWIEKKYLKIFLQRKEEKQLSYDNDIYVISPLENKEINKQTQKFVLWAALVAIAGVSFYYFPQYMFPEAFKSIMWKFDLLSFKIELEVIPLFYGIFLSYIEVVILVILNIYAINKITQICGFPRKEDPDFESQVFDLVTLGMGKNDQRIKEYRINPYKGTSIFTIVLFWVYVNIKQALSNTIAKFLIRVILGRYAVRQVVDMMGMPVYAIWNSVSIIKVIKMARLRIVAPRYIELFIQYIYEKNQKNENYKGFLLHSLQFIATTKHNYHFAHFLMAKKMLDKFDIQFNVEPLETQQYYKRYSELDENSQKDILNTIILGMIIDGSFSLREQKMLRELDDRLITDNVIKEIKIQTKNIKKNNQIQYIF